MAGTITTEDREFVESWEHISPQQWGIIRLDPRGEEKPEIISTRRTFKITSEERIITQDRIRQDSNDPFLNGSFRPVIVPDYVTIESNPNALSNEEINKILVASDLAWSEYLSTIDSVATYRRMLEIAEHSEISIKRFRALEERLGEVRGKVQIDTKDPALRRFLENRPGAGDPAAGNTTSNGSANPRRSMGGRSTDYR